MLGLMLCKSLLVVMTRGVGGGSSGLDSVGIVSGENFRFTWAQAPRDDGGLCLAGATSAAAGSGICLVSGGPSVGRTRGEPLHVILDPLAASGLGATTDTSAGMASGGNLRWTCPEVVARTFSALSRCCMDMGTGLGASRTLPMVRGLGIVHRLPARAKDSKVLLQLFLFRGERVDTVLLWIPRGLTSASGLCMR